MEQFRTKFVSFSVHNRSPATASCLLCGLTTWVKTLIPEPTNSTWLRASWRETKASSNLCQSKKFPT